jgi:amidohydrolase
VVKDFFGDEHAVELEQPLMGGEDFAYYLDKVPGAFVRLGTGNKGKKTTFPWHHSRFNIDEDALPYGTALFVKCSVEYLKNS